MVKSNNLYSVSDADERLSRARANFFIAAVGAFCAAFFFCFRSFFPIAYTFLFVAVPILLALTSLTLGLAEILQQRRGVLMHVESEGIALYPFIFPFYASSISSVFLMICGPITLLLFLIQPNSVMSLILGFSYSFLGYTMFNVTDYRPSRIHRSPLITLGPDHLSIQPLLHDNPTRIRWDRNPQIEGFELFVTANEPHQLMHVSTRDSEDAFVFEMRGMPICYWQLARLINHFVAHPEDRATLGTPQGPQLITDILTAG
ncbi:hypothetical protein [Schaalia dentiphila]|mgnify:FL=1|uniref:hypothetical protein n=1 Tax=Schaalia dentiphila TaxID=3050224 RepID=UPI00285277F1|nr:hypothetical protein [Schaalia sp. C24]